MNYRNALQSLKSNLKFRPYADTIARKMGYELVGSGGGIPTISNYRLFRRRLPENVQASVEDPYLNPFKVTIDSMTSRVGFSYAEDGWHPFVKVLEEYAENPDLSYEESTYCKLYRQFQPKTVQEVLLDDLELPQKPVCDWPAKNEFLKWIWVLNRKSVKAYLKHLKDKNDSGKGWIFFGPHSDSYGEREFDRLKSVYDSIRQNGYQTGLTELDPVNGYFLKRGKDIKFVLLQGNHRVSALKALGYKEVDVVIRRGHPVVIDKAELYGWTEEGGGLYSSELAHQLFDSLFDRSGLEKARRHNLL